MSLDESNPSARKAELLERAYGYVLRHGLADISLRPLAAEIGSSPRVLLFLFGSKDELVRALLARARAEELAFLDQLRQHRSGSPDLAVVGEEVWLWLAADDHREVLKLWVEGYGRALVDPYGPWADFARDTVRDWLELFANYQPADGRGSAAGLAKRTRLLAVLRGAMLDLLATGDRQRTTNAVLADLSAL